MLVKDWMTTYVHTVAPGDPINDAVLLMKDKNVRHLPVVENGVVAGVLSDRDIKEFVPSKGTSLDVYELNYLLAKTTVSQVMKKPAVTIAPDVPVEEAAMMLFDQRIGCLPVVEAVSTFAGVRVGQMRSTPLARLAREALEQAAALLPALAAQARLATPDEGAAVTADPDLLRRALFELTRNSLEAGEGSCLMELRLEQGEETWILEFADNGPGVPEEHRPYVFDPFYSTRPLSVGMGLPMAERIVHEHGGTVDLSCPADGGCLVRLFLPRSPRAAEHISP